MTKRIYNAALKQKVLENKELQELVRKIELPSAEDDASGSLRSGASFDVSSGDSQPPMDARAVKKLFPPSVACGGRRRITSRTATVTRLQRTPISSPSSRRATWSSAE